MARMGDWGGTYRVYGGESDGKVLLGKPRSRWEDNIKMDLQEVRWGARTGLIMPRMGTDGGLFGMQ